MARHLLAFGAAISTALALAPAEAQAQQRPVGGGFRHSPAPPPAPAQQGFIGFPGVWVVEREVIRVIEREVPAPAPAPAEPPPPPPRKPYAIGASYDSLPGGCMKMIQDGASFYLCSGEWYRQIASDSGVAYKAVKAP